MDLDDLASLARSQPGWLLPLRVLGRAGVDRFAAADLSRIGVLQRRLPGVYSVRGVSHPDMHLHLPKVYLEGRRGDPRAGISGAHVLARLGVEVPSVPARPLVLIDRSRRVRLPDAPFHTRRVDMDAVDLLRIDGVWCADPVRALLDWAHQTAPGTPELRRAAQRVRNVMRLDPGEFVQRLPDARHPGVRRLAGLVSSGEIEFDSDGERWAFERLFRRFPPAPDRQVWLGRYRVDFAYIAAALVLEYHGEAAHADRVDEDALRTFELERDGWRVLILTRSMVRRPSAVARHIHDLRRRRERDIAAGRLRRPLLPPQPRRVTPLRTALMGPAAA